MPTWKPTDDILEQCNRLLISKNNIGQSVVSFYLGWYKDDVVLQSTRIEFQTIAPWLPVVPENRDIVLPMIDRYQQQFEHGRTMLNELQVFLKNWEVVNTLSDATGSVMDYERKIINEKFTP